MTAPRIEKDPQPDNAADAPQRVQLSPVQVAASALAAVSAAVVASFFGVAGTLVGAALASVISTVSATLYTSSLRSTSQRLRRVRTQFGGPPPSPTSRPASPGSDRRLPRDLDPRQPSTRFRPPRWSWVAASAAAVFLVAMGIVTGIELIGQRPVSALVGASHTSRTTTIGALTDESAQRGSRPSTPSTRSTATATPTPQSSPPTQPSATPDRTSESATPSRAGSASSSPSPSSTAAQPTPSTETAPSATPTQ